MTPRRSALYLWRVNRLAGEKSPYLLQHAANPMDWYPWGEEAFRRARREDRPVFLSIGYATCHWCHVMAHESFENQEAAAVLNRAFVCVKVDREERPDLDQLYMTVCQVLTGSGGWPLTLILTPQKRPFFAATYIPRETSYGRAGLLELVPRVEELWRTRRQEVEASAQQVSGLLTRLSAPAPAAQSPDEALIRTAMKALAGAYDAEWGGFGPAPKFPNPANIFFLLRCWRRLAEEAALGMADHTLRQMRRGGVYDQLGGGFHRYSTDRRWRIPHFEKMLYDQALLALAYLEAFQAGGEGEHAATAADILGYVLRDLRGPEGAFFSAEDADSEGEEGRFYLWEHAELNSVLGGEHLSRLSALFPLEPQGNYREETGGPAAGRNILYLRQEADPLQLAAGELQEARSRLLEVRGRRPRPLRDDKILTDWNGLMIAALARAAAVLGERRYAEAAAEAASFILERLHDRGGGLLHRYRDGEAQIPAFASDHAFLVWGLLELYEATFDPGHVSAAAELQEIMLARFGDGQGGFFLTAAETPTPLARQRSSGDGALPAASSVALLNLLRLAGITGSPTYRRSAEAVGAALAAQAGERPLACMFALSALDFQIGPSHEVVVAGKPQAPDTVAMLSALRKPFLPSTVLVFRPTDTGEPAIVSLAPYTRAHLCLGGRATAYVCRGQSCRRPVAEPSQALEQLLG